MRSREVTTGIAAVAAYERENFDLFLTDIHMPGMDGIDAARAVRAMEQKLGRRRMPIVALTADALDRQAQRLPGRRHGWLPDQAGRSGASSRKCSCMHVSLGQRSVRILKRHELAPRYSFREYLSPKVLTMLALGFSSGLPFNLVGNTLGYWLRDEGTRLAAIGFISWVGIAYSLKFLWAPFLDRTRVPLLGRLGRRRGWMLLAQIIVGVGLAAMAMLGTGHGLAVLGAAALVAAFSAATQDTAIDAWRIESAAEQRRAWASDLRLHLRVSRRAFGHRGGDPADCPAYRLERVLSGLCGSHLHRHRRMPVRARARARRSSDGAQSP